MATPYDLYVRFLVTKGAEDVEDVNGQLAALNLPEIKGALFDLQYAVVHDSAPAGISAQILKKSYSADFMKWMGVFQVDELWLAEKTPFTGKDPEARGRVKLVVDLHQDIALRITVNALLIKGVPARDVVQAVNTKYSSMLREIHIALYEKYFFNPRLMTRGAWRNYLKVCRKQEAGVYFTALSSPLDVVKTSLDLPAKISSSESLQYLATKSFMKAKALLESNTPDSDVAARSWISTYLNVTDKYEKYRTGDQADFGQSLQMEFEFIDDEFQAPDPDVLKEIAEKKRKDEEEPSVEKPPAENKGS